MTTEAEAGFKPAPIEPLPPDGRRVIPAIEAWVRSRPLGSLVVAFGGELPHTAQVAVLLAWLEEFSMRWDYRAGKERNLAVTQAFSPGLREEVMGAAYSLGLIGTHAPPSPLYDHVLVLGGLVRACFARPLHAAHLEQTIVPSSVTALGGYRPLRGDEFALAARLGHHELVDEFDAMDAGVREAFDLGDPIDERGAPSEIVGVAWRVRDYVAPSGRSIQVIAAPSSELGRRSNTADTYAWFATKHARLQAGQRILIITTDIYVRFQHADALRMMALPYSVKVDAVGMQPGDLDERLRQEFGPGQYLQEVRSTIRSLRALYECAVAGE